MTEPTTDTDLSRDLSVGKDATGLYVALYRHRPELAAALQEAGATFQQDTKRWHFPADRADAVTVVVREFGYELDEEIEQFMQQHGEPSIPTPYHAQRFPVGKTVYSAATGHKYRVVQFMQFDGTYRCQRLPVGLTPGLTVVQGHELRLKPNEK